MIEIALIVGLILFVSLYWNWEKIQRLRWQRKYQHLQMQLSYNMPHAIHSYGATNEAEFFAVVTETFIEKPHELKQENPELYNLLKDYYQFEPRDWQRH